jgi:GlcNAc-P-P-Und epimerase
MKYLLTGGNGFIGSYLRNNISISSKNIITTLGKSNNNDIQIDLSKETIEITESFDYVIHSAAVVHNDKHANSFESESILNDFNITLNFIKSLSNSNFKKFIYLSSVSVYGLEEGTDIPLTHKVNPKSGYSLSKHLCEKILQEVIPSNKLLILRLPLVNGPNQKGNIKKAIDAINANKMIIFSGNNAKKSILELEDLASFLASNIEQFNGIHQIKSYDVNFNYFIESLTEKKIIRFPYYVLKILLVFTVFFKMKKIESVVNKISNTLTFKSSINI